MNEGEKIEKYLSSIRHDLRSQLLVVREGTSMALEGLGNRNCDKCFAFLKPALESADRLNKLIGELLSTSHFNTILAPPVSDKDGAVGNQGYAASVERMGKDELEMLKKELISDDLETLKYELMNMISHLIRTPLTVVKESLSLILDEIPGKLNDKQKQLFSNAKQNTDTLIQSVETIFQKSWDEITDSAKSTPPGGTKDRKDSSTAKNTILIVEDQAAIVDLVRMRLE
ncbi:MAG: histidine kinase dimerization/phospho-acceptor domain-containing protein, partial [Candidatus Heimdallarchaeota archaeon]